MRKPMAKKVLAASLAAAMTMSVAACGEKTPAASTSTEPVASTEPEVSASVEEEEPSPYTVLKDENGNVYDLGGMEIIVRDWWSSEEPAAPQNDFDEAQLAYREWAQETYNFKIRSLAISDWGSAPADFVDYVTSGGDDNNYVFVLRGDAAVTSAMNNNLMYDLATLDCLDFSEAKFTNNKCHELYSKGSHVYACFAGYTEPRTGVYFNKDILAAAGIDPELPYDLQAKDEWTWEAWEDMLAKVQKYGDTNNDGEQDIWAMTANEGVMTTAAVFSNNGLYVGMDADGNYTYEVENPNTVAGLEFAAKIFTEYDWNGPEGAQWDYYKEQFLNGGAAFLPDDYYMANSTGELAETSFDLGWVMFPKGPNGSLVQISTDNPHAIPACYDADRAWKIAFAWNVYSDPVPGYEDYNNWEVTAASGNRDERTCSETVPMISTHGGIAYHGVVPNMDLGEGFLWAIGPGADVSSVIDGVRDKYKAYINEANQ